MAQIHRGVVRTWGMELHQFSSCWASKDKGNPTDGRHISALFLNGFWFYGCMRVYIYFLYMSAPKSSLNIGRTCTIGI